MCRRFTTTQRWADKARHSAYRALLQILCLLLHRELMPFGGTGFVGQFVMRMQVILSAVTSRRGCAIGVTANEDKNADNN